MNTMTNVEIEMDADANSAAFINDLGDMDMPPSRFDVPEGPGKENPVGARAHLAGREHIIMTEWGPYDWQGPLLTAVETKPKRHVYTLLGPELLTDATLQAPPGVELTRDKDSGRLVVATDASGSVLPYELTVTTASGPQTVTGALVPVVWDVVVFPTKVDPREQPDAWRRQAQEHGLRCTLQALDVQYGNKGPSGVGLAPTVTEAELPADHFGTIAVARMNVPAGKWRIRTRSDDGIQVWIDDDLVINDWTWHPPRSHTYEFALEQTKQINVRVEHFELDGYAVVSFDLEPID
ncbi:MAG: PA14 domain-containing protein [Planctomycetota bacterium]